MCCVGFVSVCRLFCCDLPWVLYWRNSLPIVHPFFLSNLGTFSQFLYIYIFLFSLRACFRSPSESRFVTIMYQWYKLFRKNTWSLMNYKELICFQQTKVQVVATQKRAVVWMEKKIWKSLLGEKHLLGNPVHFSVKNTANNADTGGVPLAILSALV